MFSNKLDFNYSKLHVIMFGNKTVISEREEVTVEYKIEEIFSNIWKIKLQDQADGGTRNFQHKISILKTNKGLKKWLCNWKLPDYAK